MIFVCHLRPFFFCSSTWVAAGYEMERERVNHKSRGRGNVLLWCYGGRVLWDTRHGLDEFSLGTSIFSYFFSSVLYFNECFRVMFVGIAML